jgi:hypothetical protein
VATLTAIASEILRMSRLRAVSLNLRSAPMQARADSLNLRSVSLKLRTRALNFDDRALNLLDRELPALRTPVKRLPPGCQMHCWRLQPLHAAPPSHLNA